MHRITEAHILNILIWVIKVHTEPLKGFIIEPYVVFPQGNFEGSTYVSKDRTFKGSIENFLS